MAKFLSGKDLSEKIRRVCKGNNLRVAVAFLGAGARADLFPDVDLKQARVICDISMGGTNPEELKAMGAPENGNLRFLDGLHSKVYLSDNGCVVGSANASDNGIGFKTPARHVEAGVFYEKQDTEMILQVNSWFEEIWERHDCKVVDETALESACNRFKKNGSPRVPKGENLIDTLLQDPGALGDWGVVITKTSLSQKVEKRLQSEQMDKINQENG